MSQLEDDLEDIKLAIETKYCPKCRDLRNAELNYCGICGIKLVTTPIHNVFCSKCHNELDIIEFYCPFCGYKIKIEEILNVTVDK